MATSKKKTETPKPVKLQVKTGLRAGKKPGRTTYANITLERFSTGG
ncbi:MAG: hypothetical protein AAF211_09990 [Myxococcota bacterium]